MSDVLCVLWYEVCIGSEILVVLWVVWMYLVCDVQLEQEIYGDIYMIQYQIGIGMWVDMGMLKQLIVDNSELCW